jgi:Glycosyltransferase family 87
MGWLVCHFLLGAAVLLDKWWWGAFCLALLGSAVAIGCYRRDLRAPPAKALPWLIGASLVLVLVRLPTVGWVQAFLAVLTVLQAAIAIAACGSPRLDPRRALAAILVLYTLGGGLLVARAPAPNIDVLEVQQLGAIALENGRNPYQATFPNPYGKEETFQYFGDHRDNLQNYPYPPLSLLITTLGHRLGGDVRWALLGAQVLLAWLVFALARGAGHAPRFALTLATLCVLHPRGLYLLEQSWTDSLLAASFLAVLLCLQRKTGRWLGVALGAFLAAKQYSIIAVPLLLGSRRVPARAWALALVVAAGIVLPFFAWSPADFLEDVVLFQARQPFRMDALSIPAAVARLTGLRAPGALSFAAAAVATLGVFPRADSERRAALPEQTAIVSLAFFLFAKQAFCNYYYFVGILVLAAVATLEPEAAA